MPSSGTAQHSKEVYVNRLKELKMLKEKAEELQLENREILSKYTLTELSAIYNGIGPDSFPEWLRKFISALHPSLAVVALIHDVEWHESDKTQKTFDESNARFKANGYKVAEAEFGWYNPRRYVVMNQARRFGNICQFFGWKAWMTDCVCTVCRKRRENEVKEAKANA